MPPRASCKDGPKNRLREQDIHRIVDTFTRQDESDPRYARMVPVDEIADPKNDYNLNLPRYIDSTEPEDLQDIDGHLRGGIPVRDIDDPVRLKALLEDPCQACAALYLKMPAALATASLRVPVAEVKSAIFGHAGIHRFPEFRHSAIRQVEEGEYPALKRIRQRTVIPNSSSKPSPSICSPRSRPRRFSTPTISIST